LTYDCHLAVGSLQRRQNLATLGGIRGMQTRPSFGTHKSRMTDDLRPYIEPVLLVLGDCRFAACTVSRRNCCKQPVDPPIGE
jgi:hypothetical protein